MTSELRARWFAVALVPAIAGALVAIVSILGVKSDVDKMQRVIVPGGATLALDAGDYIIFGERVSRVADVAYRTSGFSVRCGIAAPDGSSVTLGSPTASTSYSFGGYARESMFEFTVEHAGAYQIRCTGDDPPAVIAIGRGLGTRIAIAAISGGGGLAGAAVIIFVIRRRRKSSRARTTAAT